MPNTRSLHHNPQDVANSNAVNNTSAGLQASNNARIRPTSIRTRLQQQTAQRGGQPSSSSSVTVARHRTRSTPQSVGDVTLPELNLHGLSSTEEDTDDASVARAAITSRTLSQRPRQPRLVRQAARRPVRTASPADGRGLRTTANTATIRGDVNGTAHARPRQRLNPQSQPASGHAGNGRKHEEEESDFMNRQADGSYLLGLYTSDGNGPGTSSRSLGFGASAGAGGIPWAQQEQEDFMNAQKDEEEEAAHYSLIARKFFAAGYALDGHGSKHAHEELEETRVAMMARLREETLKCLNETRWKYEPTDRFQPGLP